MQVSKKAIDPTLNSKLDYSLNQLIIDTSTIEEAVQFIETLLSETERVAIKKRLGIALMLREHKPYEEIKSQLNVSSATIATVQSLMSQTGMQAILEKVKINIMADQWSTRVKKLFSVFSRNRSS